MPGRALMRLHRRVGISLAVLFLAICASGILLNHSSDLDLHRKRVSAKWIYDWYGIEPLGEMRHFSISGQSFASLDGRLFHEGRDIAPFGELVGVAETESLLVLASRDALLLMSRDGAIVEQIGASALPAGDILRIQSATDNRIRIQTITGSFLSDEALLEWEKSPWEPHHPPIEPSQPPPSLEQSARETFRGEGITWNRVLLDLHSGRFFGPAGKWLADLSALGLILLTVTGIYYAATRAKRERPRTDVSTNKAHTFR